MFIFPLISIKTRDEAVLKLFGHARQIKCTLDWRSERNYGFDLNIIIVYSNYNNNDR